MHLVLLGINHSTAPVTLRERFVFSGDETGEFCLTLTRIDGIEEAVLLSTCNRTEVIIRYGALSPQKRIRLPEILTTELCNWKQISSIEKKSFYHFIDRAAINHLLRVAAGLESMIVGEAQILAQVKDAYRYACEAKTNGFVLNKVMHSSFRVGKRARTETDINIGAVSVSLAAAELAQQQYRHFEQKNGLVIGAGEMAHLATEHLVKKKVGSLTITNRTNEKAYSLARHTGTSAFPYAHLSDSLVSADFVLSAISASEPIISRQQLEFIMKKRNFRELVLIDISVPRSIDEQATLLKGITLFDIDTLNSIVDKNLLRRKSEMPKVETIINEEIEKLYHWYRSLEITPTIKELVHHFERVRQKEIRRGPQDLSPEQEERLELMTKRLVKKILREPIERLRKSQCTGIDNAAYWVDAIRSAFNLEPEINE
ncbi:MAG: glutamyl-tRNA reductase [Chitinivibrionales bacterium]|nr:glutamyl-tRNA reductase [Chitinivibrionales bacterium]